VNPTAFRAARDADIETYNSIQACLDRLGDARELAKIKLLDSLFSGNDRLGVLAFDRHPATLVYLDHLAAAHGLLTEVTRLTATGASTPAERRKVNTFLDNRNALDRNVLVLCSDAMSEGYNLQNASVVVHLDMPSVVRLVEQRIGRVDRMDSVHPSIQVYWPNDNAAFALGSDDRFIERFEANAMLLGSNFELPQSLHSADVDSSSRYRSILEVAEQQDNTWDGITDAFEPVRGLIGATGLISQSHYAGVSAGDEVGTSISAVTSASNWAFFCVAGTEFGAPKWVLFDEYDEVHIDLQEIASRLDRYLAESPVTADLKTEHCHKSITNYVSRLEALERSLLPRRKQVALAEMAIILQAWRSKFGREEVEFIDKLLGILDGTVETEIAVNWSLLAEYWLELIRPVWYDELKSNRGRKALGLSDLRAQLIKAPLGFELLRERFVEIPGAPPVSDRLSACILGIGQ